MNEAETRAELIDPKIKEAGWGDVEGSFVKREFKITNGEIKPGGIRAGIIRADYVLIYKNRKLAVIEAKNDELNVSDGVSQAKDYAQKLKLLTSYSSNGNKIYEINYSKKEKGEMFITSEGEVDKMDVIEYATKKIIEGGYNPDIVVSLQPNSPEFKGVDLDNAIDFFLKELYDDHPVCEVMSINPDMLQNACFRIITTKTVFQKTFRFFFSKKNIFFENDFQNFEILEIFDVRNFVFFRYFIIIYTITTITW